MPCLKSNYNKSPFIEVEKDSSNCFVGWQNIFEELNAKISSSQNKKIIVVVECYHGVSEDILLQLQQNINHTHWIQSKNAFKDEEEILKMVHPDVTDDTIFGYLTKLRMVDYFNQKKLKIVKTG